MPIDDERTWESFSGRGKGDLIPGTFRLKTNLSNDFNIDRDLQRTKTFTGIRGINTQDIAVQEGMGPIADRSKEHLGTSDKAVITIRQLLLEAVQRVEDGGDPPGLDPAAQRMPRGYDEYVPRGVPWREHLREALVPKW